MAFPCRFELCSGKADVEVQLPIGGRKLSVARVMRVLHIVGVVFAVIGITAALNLFSAKNANDLASAQQDRKTSNAVSLYMPAYSAAVSRRIIQFSGEDVSTTSCSLVVLRIPDT